MQPVPAAGGLVERDQVADRVHLVMWGQPGGDRLVAERVVLRVLESAEPELRGGRAPVDQREVVGIVDPPGEPEPPQRQLGGRRKVGGGLSVGGVCGETEGEQLNVVEPLGDRDRALGRRDVVLEHRLPNQAIRVGEAVRRGVLERLLDPSRDDRPVRSDLPHRAAHRRLEGELGVELAALRLGRR